VPPVSAVIFRLDPWNKTPAMQRWLLVTENSEYAFFGVGVIVGGGSPGDEARAAHERRAQPLGA
jgi:hypothetical protein